MTLLFQGVLSHVRCLFLGEVFPEPIRCQDNEFILLAQLYHFDIWLGADVRPAEDRNRKAEAKSLIELVEVELPVLEPEIAKGARRLQTSLGVALSPSIWLPLAEEYVRLAFEGLFHAILLRLFIDRMSITETNLFICIGSICLAAEKNSFRIASVGHIQLSIFHNRDEGCRAAVCWRGESFIKRDLGHLQPFFLLLHEGLLYRFFDIVVAFCINQLLLDTDMQMFGTVFGQLPAIISIKNGRVEPFEAFNVDLLARQSILARCVARILHGLGSTLEFVSL